MQKRLVSNATFLIRISDAFHLKSKDMVILHTTYHIKQDWLFDATVRFVWKRKITAYFLQLIRIFLKLLHDQGNVVHALQIGAAAGKGRTSACGNFLCQGGYISMLWMIGWLLQYRIHTLL